MTNRIILISFACVSLINAARVDDWWEYANFYQVYPRSFQDSDGDGVGDLKGITQRLEYFEYLGIDGIWLSPIFKSPMKDFGYDITDYREIHHEYGTMADFKELLRRCHELNIKLILDFVPNHSSDQHVWFKASSDPNHPRYRKYKDYYIWHDGAKAENGTVIGPPSNWLSVFRNSAWTFHPKRKQYYLHQFLPSQPDLNFRNPAVAQEMNDILRFWYDKGVDGFRIDAIPFLFEVEENPATGRYDDEPLSGWCDPDQHCYLKHIHTDNLDETFEMVYQWRKLSDSYKDSTRILMTEAYSSVDDNMRYYGGVVDGELVDGVHIPFNFEFISHAREESNAYVYEECIWNWLYKMPNRPGVHANWLLGNHDQKRIGSKYGAARVDLLNIMLKTLPGMSITYYGEEIGMNDVHISWEDTVDPQACLTNPDIYSYVSRDPARSPMQWNSTRNAGFSSGRKTWLPLAKDFKTNNIELQTRQQESHLKVFKSLVELRNHPTMRYGQVHTRVYEYDVLVYTREIEENLEAEVFFIILNFGTQNMSVPLSSAMAIAPEKLKVVLTSTKSDLFVGQTVDSASISIEAGGAAILVGKRVQRIGLAVSIYTVSGLVFVFILVRLYCHFRNRNSKPSS